MDQGEHWLAPDAPRNRRDYCMAKCNTEGLAAGTCSQLRAERPTRAGAGGGAPLGIKTETPSTPRNPGPPAESTPHHVNPLTGAIQAERDAKLARAERHMLQATAREVLGKAHRIEKCGRWRTPQQEVKLWKDQEHGKAFFSGVRACALPWVCPCCAAKISERRRVELVAGVAAAKAMGWDVKLLTLTVPHGLGDDLEKLTARMLGALKRLSNGRVAKELRELLGLKGTVRAFEVTYGANGFHPHFHILLFLDKQWTNNGVHEAFVYHWQNACRLAGLPIPHPSHGCRVDDGTYAAKYASKWGLESEMTKGHTKKGKQGGMTPFDLLRAIFNQDEKSPKFAALFRIYHDAFKGKRQLYWSNGLRKLLGLDQEASDEELAAAQTESAALLATLTADQWRAIVHASAQSHVLDVAEDHPERLGGLLEYLVTRYLEYRKRRRHD